MDVHASLRYFRVGPRKVRLITNLLQGKSVAEAQAQLSSLGKVAAVPLQKLISSAVANAKNNFQLTEEHLYIKQFRTDEGPKLRRFMPKAFGRAGMILRRSSHVTVILSERTSPTTATPDKGKKATAETISPAASADKAKRPARLARTKSPKTSPTA